jgi:uncharacterized protein
MTLLKIAAGFAVLYLAFALLITLVQDRLMFPRWAMVSGAATLPAERRAHLHRDPGRRTAGRYRPSGRTCPSAGDCPSSRVWRKRVGCGFSGPLPAFPLSGPGHRHLPLPWLRTERGPTECRCDPRGCRTHLRRMLATLGGGRIVVVGLSLGAGPAAHLGSLRPVDGLILVTPFDSIEALAGDLYPWLPVRLLLRHRMDVAGAVDRSSAKVAIIAAERDEIVPARRTEALRRSSRDLVLDRIIPGVGHNDIYNSRDFVEAMREALSLIEDQDRPAR